MFVRSASHSTTLFTTLLLSFTFAYQSIYSLRVAGQHPSPPSLQKVYEPKGPPQIYRHGLMPEVCASGRCFGTPSCEIIGIENLATPLKHGEKCCVPDLLPNRSADNLGVCHCVLVAIPLDCSGVCSSFNRNPKSRSLDLQP